MANETILVVDADAKSQKVLEVSFKKTGYRVIMVASQREAIESLSAQLPDLIIADTKLPDGDGFIFCEQLKANTRFKDIPLMFLTEEDELSKKMQAFELGAADYLTKPIFIKEVTSRVETLLHRRAKDSINVEDGEQVEGSLEEVTMIDLLQAIESDNRSGTIHLERQGTLASVHFKEGDIIDAICGKLQGEEAIYRLMLWPNGSFVIRYHEQGKRADHVEKDATALLIEGIQRLERWTDMVSTLPNLQRVYEADYEKLPDILRNLPKEVGQVVRLFDGYRTLRDIIDNSPVDDLLTLRIIRKLLEDHSLIDVTPEDADLDEREGQTNLASWLTGQQRAQKRAQPAQPEEAPEPALTVRPDRALFTTAHGQQQIPSLNSATVPDEPEEFDSFEAPADEPEDAQDEHDEHDELAQHIEEALLPATNSPSLAELVTHVPEPVTTPAVIVVETQASDDEQELEEGQAPEAPEKSWRFHWDANTQKAIAIRREDGPQITSEDPFALESLAQDLEETERRRQEEEARRIAADRDAADRASGMFASVAEHVAAQRAQEEEELAQALADDDDDDYVSKDDTKELHRNAVLAELEERKRREEERERTPTPLAIPAQPTKEEPKTFDPLEDIQDMLPPSAKRVEAAASLKQQAQAVARAAEQPAQEEDDEPWRQERQRTDQFISIPREEPQPAASELIPLGSPADASSEPEVSEEDLARLTQQEQSAEDYTLEEISSPSMVAKAHTSQDEVLEDEEDEDEDEGEDEDVNDSAAAVAAPEATSAAHAVAEEEDEDEDEDEEEDEEDEELEDEDDDKTPASKLAQRTAHNKELVHTEYDLKEDRAAPALADEESEEEDEDEEEDEPTPSADAKAPAEGKASATEEELEEEVTLDIKRQDEDADESAEVPVAAPAAADADKAEDKAPEADAEKAEDKAEPAATKPSAQAPLEDRFEDLEPPEQGFNTKGLAIVAGVIIAALLAIFAFIKSQNTEPDPAANNKVTTVTSNTNSAQTTPTPPTTTPDLGKPKPAADMGATTPAADQGATTPTGDMGAPPAADMGKVATDMSATAPIAAADMGKSAPAADMAVAQNPTTTPDMGKSNEPNNGQGGTTTQDPNNNKAPDATPERTFAQRLNEAEGMVKRERFSPARRILKELAKAEPNNGQVAALLGSCEYNMGNDDAALRELNKAIRSGYRSEQLYLDLASVYTAKQNNAKAIDAYNQFLKNYPSSSRAAKVRGYRDNLK